jgi:hypothetical protein
MLPPGGAGGGPDVSPGAAAGGGTDWARAALTKGPAASVAAVRAKAISVLRLMSVISDDVTPHTVNYHGVAMNPR